MKNIEYVKRCLKNGISKNPLMLHGTSIEAVFELAITGRMPSGIPEIREDYFNDETLGHLFFVAVDSGLKEKYDRLIVLSRKSCFEDAKGYARMAGFANYLAQKLNCQTAELYSMFNYWQGGSLEPKDIQTKLRKHGLELSLEKIAELDYHARKRKGVIIEPNESILELPHEADHTSLCFECPNGIDKKYIKGIELLGPVEKRLMRKFQKGKLKYKGFKTDLPEEYQDIY